VADREPSRQYRRSRRERGDARDTPEPPAQAPSRSNEERRSSEGDEPLCCLFVVLDVAFRHHALHALLVRFTRLEGGPARAEYQRLEQHDRAPPARGCLKYSCAHFAGAEWTPPRDVGAAAVGERTLESEPNV